MGRLERIPLPEWLDGLLLRLGVALAGLIVIGILLTVLGANRDNFIVSLLASVAEFLVTPFEDMFVLDDRDARVALNWGIGAFAYLVLGVVLAGLAGRLRERRVG